MTFETGVKTVEEGRVDYAQDELLTVGQRNGHATKGEIVHDWEEDSDDSVQLVPSSHLAGEGRPH